ncbi:MAG: hypothetical protein ACPF8V_06240 [Luteibaculum sp.]
MQHQLNTFRILFIIKGVFNLLISLLPLLYYFLGKFLFPLDQGTPDFMRAIFIYGGSIGFFICFGLAVCTFVASNFLQLQKGYYFIMVVAIVNAFTGVLGILLCIFTLIEITNPETKKLFFREEF